MNSTTVWTRILAVPVGGLTEIGLSEDERYILIVSHNGRGVLDAQTGDRVARDYDPPTPESSWLREPDRLVRGLGPLANLWVPVVGLWGGSLPETCDGWRVITQQSNQAVQVRVAHESDGISIALTETVTETRAVGFLRSKRLLVATSSDLELFGRAV